MSAASQRAPRQAAKRALAFVTAACIAFAPPGYAAAQRAEPAAKPTAKPDVGAESWALVDARTGRYLEGESPDERRAIAATTSIMTSLVALEQAQDPQTEVTVPKEAERYVGFTYSNIGLIAGERLSVRELIEAVMISSGMDAVYTLTSYLGAGDTENFVDMMNEKAEELGLQDTSFANPFGLDEEGNYSSARDLADLARTAMQDPRFAEIVNTRQTTVSTQNRKIDLYNTNGLLASYPAADGVKTGGSPDAGSCLVASASRGEESYIAVVLGSADAASAEAEARSILRHGFESYESRPLVRENEPLSSLPLPYRSGESVELAASKEISGLVAPASEVEREVSTRPAPNRAAEGQKLGTVEVFVDGASIGSSPLVTSEPYLQASLWERAQLAATWPFDKLRGMIQK